MPFSIDTRPKQQAWALCGLVRSVLLSPKLQRRSGKDASASDGKYERVCLREASPNDRSKSGLDPDAHQEVYMRIYEIIRLQAKPPLPRATVQASPRAKVQKAREKTLK